LQICDPALAFNHDDLVSNTTVQIMHNAHAEAVRGVARILHWGPQKLGAKGGAKGGLQRGVPSPTDYWCLGSVVSSPSGVRGGARRQRIFGIFEAHRTLLVERTVLLY